VRLPDNALHPTARAEDLSDVRSHSARAGGERALARAVVENDAGMKLLNKDFVQYLRGCLQA